MSLHNQKVKGVRVLDTAEEGAKAIETMVNQVIGEMRQQGVPIIDIQVTDNNCFLILGEKKPDWVDQAGVAQLVECQLPKLNVAGSNPVSRSLINLNFNYKIMRLTKELTEHLTKNIVKSFLDKELIIWEESPEKLQTIINGIITEDLMVEDRLNDEVKTLLDSKTEEYERSMMDYGRVFQMVKSKLVRERGLIL